MICIRPRPGPVTQFNDLTNNALRLYPSPDADDDGAGCGSGCGHLNWFSAAFRGLVWLSFDSYPLTYFVMSLSSTERV